MNYKLKYSQDAREKLQEIKKNIADLYGSSVSKRIITKIMSEIRGLQDNPRKGAAVQALIDLHTSYRFIHTEQNYVFYRIEDNIVYITDIYNEHEDFMQKMFHINLRTRASIDYWGE